VVAVPRDSATLILLRNTAEANGGIEILMLRRHSRSSFLPGSYVFPGGVVETADYVHDIEEFCSGLTFAEAQVIVDDASPPEKALGFFVAAIRETFEEAGLLLAYDGVDRMLIHEGGDPARLAKYRRDIRDDPASLAAVLRREGLKLATDRLYYFSHWITPAMVPTRFDTRFFLAVAPDNQEVSHDRLETTDSRWISPREVLDLRLAGKLTVPYPTYRNVKDLVGISTVEEAIAFTTGREVPGIQPLLNMLQLGG